MTLAACLAAVMVGPLAIFVCTIAWADRRLFGFPTYRRFAAARFAARRAGFIAAGRAEVVRLGRA